MEFVYQIEVQDSGVFFFHIMYSLYKGIRPRDVLVSNVISAIVSTKYICSSQICPFL